MNLSGLLVATSPATGLDMLEDLATIMCVAAATTVIFQRLRQPVVLGYLLAGLIVGPHLPIPFFADETLAHQLSELGVILLMFSLGLEFNLRKLASVGPTAGLVAVVQCSLMIWLGYVTGRAFGWTGLESVFAGAIIAISSTTIIVKAFAEQGVGATGGKNRRLTEIVFGILIVEDLIAILLLAILTPVATGASLSAGGLFLTVLKLMAFLVGLMVVGILTVPRLMRYLVRAGRTETLVVASVGICFAFALLARKFGYSVALGAFLAGALVAESGEAKTVEHIVEPVRDVFAAIFFVSVGMLIDPVLVLEHWEAVLVLTVVVVIGKVVGVAFGAFLAGNSVNTSVRAGMSLAQIGEFSFIIAGVGLSLGAVRSFIYPVAVAVSALTTLITPYLIRASGPVASIVDRHLPHPLQTFASLYGSWVAALREIPTHRTAWAQIRKLALLLLVDMAVISGVVIVASVSRERLVAFAQARQLLTADVVRWGVVVAALVVAAPFLLGAVRVARALGVALAAEALPRSEGTLDLAAAPRRALLVTFQLAILIVVGVPLVAVTQPFLPGFPGIAVLMIALILLVIPFWRSAANLHGHVRAGAQVILEALASRAQPASSADSVEMPAVGGEVKRLVPGLGDAATVSLGSSAPSVGQTLKALDLRGQTGATVIAIDRGPEDIVYPTADEILRAGDVLVLTGSQESVNNARELLTGASASPGTPGPESASQPA